MDSVHLTSTSGAPRCPAENILGFSIPKHDQVVMEVLKGHDGHEQSRTLPLRENQDQECSNRPRTSGNVPEEDAAGRNRKDRGAWTETFKH